MFEDNIWNFIRNYYYIYQYWINHNFSPFKNLIIIILKVYQAK